MNAMSNRYTSIIDTETYDVVPDDTIVEIDAHLGVPIPHEQYNHPEVTVEELDLVIDQLRAVGSNEMANRMEIERRHLEHNDDHIFRFTALELAKIVVPLSIAKTKLAYQGDMDSSLAISSFGRLVTESTTELMAESIKYKEIKNMKSISRDISFVDPFLVISSVQQLAFVDSHGERITKDYLVASDHVDELL